jgi:hypothetical protein
MQQLSMNNLELKSNQEELLDEQKTFLVPNEPTETNIQQLDGAIALAETQLSNLTIKLDEMRVLREKAVKDFGLKPYEVVEL